MTVIIDTREQTPYSFKWCDAHVPTERKALCAGDYSLVGHEKRISIERKTHADAFGSLGRGRRRFRREIEILSQFEYSAIIIECSLQSFLDAPPNSCLNPVAAINTLISWDVRFGVRTIFAGSRGLAEIYTYRILEKFHNAAKRNLDDKAGAREK